MYAWCFTPLKTPAWRSFPVLLNDACFCKRPRRFCFSPFSLAPSQNGGGPLASPAGIGGEAGSAGALEPSPAGGGIDGNNKMSASMRRLGGRMRGMGVKAVAMAKIASQASPAAHLRLGGTTLQERLLRQVFYFCGWRGI